MGRNSIHAGPQQQQQMYQDVPSERPAGVLLPGEAGGQQRVVRELPSPKPLQSSSSFINSFKGLENLTLDKRSRIFQAKSIDEAKSSVGILQRFLDFFRGLVKWPTSTEAATNLFNAVHGKGSVEAFHAIRAAVRPEERHHFKMDVVEHKTGERQFRMLAGELELFDSGPLPKNDPLLQQAEGAQRIAAASDILGGLTPPIDVEATLQHIQATGDFKAFQALRSQLADPDLFNIRVTADSGLLYYTLKVGETAIFNSPPLLDDTLTDSDKGDLAGKQPLAAARTETLHHKLENAMLAAKVARALDLRPRADNDIPELGELEATERAVVAALDGKTTVWDKYAAIADFVLERTRPEACMFSTREPFPLELTADDDAGIYTLTVDKHTVDTTAVAHGDSAGHVAAAASAISVAGKTAMRYLDGENPVAKYREGNIQCMSDRKDIQQFINDNLDNPTFSSRNFIRIDTPDTTRNDETLTFSAVFAAADGSEQAIEFSDRSPTRGEFRGHILKKALTGDVAPYANLAELTALGHMSEKDGAVVYMLSPLRENINHQSIRLERIGANVDGFISSVKEIALSGNLTLGKILYPQGD